MHSGLLTLFVLPVNPRNPQVERIHQEKALGEEEEDGDQVCYRSLWPAAPHRQFQLHGKPAGMDAPWAVVSAALSGQNLLFHKVRKL